jgi:hypothetical protein
MIRFALVLLGSASSVFAADDFVVRGPEKVQCHVARTSTRGTEVIQTLSFRKQGDAVTALFNEALSSKWFGKTTASVSQHEVTWSVRGDVLLIATSEEQDREDYVFELKLPMQLPRYNYQIPVNAEFKSKEVLGGRKLKQLKVSCGVAY